MRWTGREKKGGKKTEKENAAQKENPQHAAVGHMTWKEKCTASRRCHFRGFCPALETGSSQRTRQCLRRARWQTGGHVIVLLLLGAAVKPHFSCTSFRRKPLLTHSKAGGTTHNKCHSAESVLTRATSLLCTAGVAKHLRVAFCRVNRVFLHQSVAFFLFLFFGPDPQQSNTFKVCRLTVQKTQKCGRDIYMHSRVGLGSRITMMMMSIYNEDLSSTSKRVKTVRAAQKNNHEKYILSAFNNTTCIKAVMLAGCTEA